MEYNQNPAPMPTTVAPQIGVKPPTSDYTDRIRSRLDVLQRIEYQRGYHEGFDAGWDKALQTIREFEAKEKERRDNANQTNA